MLHNPLRERAGVRVLRIPIRNPQSKIRNQKTLTPPSPGVPGEGEIGHPHPPHVSGERAGEGGCCSRLCNEGNCAARHIATRTTKSRRVPPDLTPSTLTCFAKRRAGSADW